MNIPFVLKSQLRFEQCQCIINIFITFIVIIIIWLQIVWQNVCPGIVPLNSILWNLRMACFNLRASWLEVILYACECITSWNNDTFVFKKRRVLGTKEKHVFFFRFHLLIPSILGYYILQFIYKLRSLYCSLTGCDLTQRKSFLMFMHTTFYLQFGESLFLYPCAFRKV